MGRFQSSVGNKGRDKGFIEPQGWATGDARDSAPGTPMGEDGGGLRREAD